MLKILRQLKIVLQALFVKQVQIPLKVKVNVNKVFIVQRMLKRWNQQTQDTLQKVQVMLNKKLVVQVRTKMNLSKWIVNNAQ